MNGPGRLSILMSTKDCTAREKNHDSPSYVKKEKK